MGHQIEIKARNSSRQGGFSAGTGLATPGTDQDAGGSNLAKPFPKQEGGTALNKGRLKPGREVHYVTGTRNKGGAGDGGTRSIPDSAQIKSRGGDVTPR